MLKDCDISESDSKRLRRMGRQLSRLLSPVIGCGAINNTDLQHFVSSFVLLHLYRLFCIQSVVEVKKIIRGKEHV